MAALLHDVAEDCGVSIQELSSRFGAEVGKLVDGVTKLTRMDYRLQASSGNGATPHDDPDPLQAESLRKMLVAMAQDIRVVLIKLADRLHNMQTLDAMPPDKRRSIAQETLDIYSPLAHRLGIWDIKWRLDDLAFRHLDEVQYREIARVLASRRTEREAFVAQTTDLLREELQRANLKAEVTGRPKSIYSIAQKMKKYAAQGKELRDIYDVFALRVLVDSVEECYKALGITHQLWRPMPGQFDDYIANPKENMYQALHTTVACEGGKQPLEVQIKTHAMHQVAEYGVAAHWRYKEGRASDLHFEEKMTWLRQLLDWQRDAVGTSDFIESVKQDIFKDHVFVYTPKGDIVELTAASTPIDFAYKIHTELGNKCIGAKVNGRLVALNTPLSNSDTVEILTSKGSRGPSPDWLNANLGYVTSASAKQRVRQWFHRQARSTNIQRGREVLRRELRRLSLKLEESEILKLVKYDSMDEFLVSLGSGGITESLVAQRLSQARQEPEPEPEVHKPSLPLSSPQSGVTVLGVGDLLIRMARCCHPIPGDPIVGFVTRARGVTVHKKDCSSLKNEDEPERIVQVAWGAIQELYPVRVRMKAYDRVGLLRDITTRVSEDRVNIASVVTTEQSDGTVTIELTLHTTGLDQLGKLFARLEGVQGVTSVSRARSGASAPAAAAT
jgi:GTP pyrophosphokinase